MGAFEDFLSGADASKRSKDNQAYIQSLGARVDRINALEATIEDLDDDELQAKTREFRARLAQGEEMNGPLLEEAFAVVREAAWYVYSIVIHS
jgi:preprotein translocase subunit SecA